MISTKEAPISTRAMTGVCRVLIIMTALQSLK
jgi:hypothetical protein